MKTIGTTRYIDDLGRITIPREIFYEKRTWCFGETDL